MKSIYAIFVTLSVVFFTTNIFAQPSFTPKTDFATGTSPNCAVNGDLNGDGRPDLAVANYNSSTVSVLLNTTPPDPDSGLGVRFAR